MRHITSQKSQDFLKVVLGYFSTVLCFPSYSNSLLLEEIKINCSSYFTDCFTAEEKLMENPFQFLHRETLALRLQEITGLKFIPLNWNELASSHPNGLELSCVVEMEPLHKSLTIVSYFQAFSDSEKSRQLQGESAIALAMKAMQGFKDSIALNPNDSKF